MSGLFDLGGKLALVTGGARGLGLAIAEACAAHGATVVIADLDVALARQEATSLQRKGGKVHALGCDVSRADDVERLAEQVESAYGAIDILVCNAGVQGPAGPLGEADEAAWDRVMDINLRSMWRLTGKIIPGMARRGSGSVILMASIAGIRGNKSIGLYGLSKAAVAQLARNLAVEWGPSGVRVNAISPGLIRTPLAATMLSDEKFMQRRMSLTPLRRPGEPHEVAGAAVLLASAAGGFITGHNLVVDGGTTISDGG